MTVGQGENRFRMSRGSFRYKQKIYWKHACECTGIKEQSDGFDLLFLDIKTKKEYTVLVREKDGCIEVHCQGENENTNRFWITLPTNENEHIYGCGETYSEWDLKGQKVRIWVAEHQNANRIARKILKDTIRGVRPKKKLPFSRYESYYVQPTFVSSDCHYVHVYLKEYAEFDFTAAGMVTLYTQELPHFVCEAADSFEELSHKLSKRLGGQRKLPDWIYEGGILAMQDWIVEDKKTHEGYDGCGNVERKVAKAREAGASVVGVWCQDWCGCRCTGFGYQVMWNWVYDEKQYPGLPEKIAEWKKQGIGFLGYINPFLALEKELYEEAHRLGYCVKNAKGEDYLVTITTFPAAMVDFTNPAAYSWYKEIIKKNMIGIGMRGWMADFGEYLPVDAVLYEGNPKELHNQWPAIWARLNREAIEECQAQEEIFFFTRAGYTGSVGDSAMMWTGDQHVDWSVDDGLPSVIPATLSLAMSGFGITHSDVGGYTTIMNMTRSKELLLRWSEMNVFSPLYRTHEGNQPSRDVQFDFDEETLAQTTACTRMHQALGFYLKKCVDATVQKGTPVMRPLFYHYQEEECFTLSSEYLLGADILVAPVLEAEVTSRSVFLPEDHWVHLFSEQEYAGGWHTIEAPIGQPPVFVRRGSADFERLMKIKKE